MGSAVTLAAGRMGTRAIVSKCRQLTYQLRADLTLPLKEREQMLDLIDQLVHELSVRADQGKLF